MGNLFLFKQAISIRGEDLQSRVLSLPCGQCTMEKAGTQIALLDPSPFAFMFPRLTLFWRLMTIIQPSLTFFCRVELEIVLESSKLSMMEIFVKS